MATPQAYVDRLTQLAASARHHPEPAVAVSLLAQLLLDVVRELQPLAEKYSLILKASGASAVFEALEEDLRQAELQLAATALPGAQLGAYADQQPDPNSTTAG